MKNEPVELPLREPTLRVTTRPNDANAGGDIFGGWLMSQIDVAGAIAAIEAAAGPVVTVAVKSLQFIHPIYIYNIVSFYTEVISVGNSSVTIKIEVFARQREDIEHKIFKVSEAVLVYVAVDKPGVKRVIKK